MPVPTEVSHVCILCSGREEMAHAVRTVVSGVEHGALQVSDVTQQLLSSCLYTNTSPDPELLIRTSGEVRLSDYLLWQVGNFNGRVSFYLHCKAKNIITDRCHCYYTVNYCAFVSALLAAVQSLFCV
jgi:hypothetical protein